MTTDGSEVSLVFVRREKVGVQAALFIAGGLIFFACMILYFIMIVRRPARPGDDMIPGMLGGVSVIGIALLARGLFLLRTTVRVVVDPAALHIETLLSHRVVAWTDVARVERDKRSALMGIQSYQVIRLIGHNGKTQA